MIIAISGRMASGKTALAKALTGKFGGTAASFGDHVRAIAASQGRGSDRETLQEIGQSAVDEDVGKFVVDFLSGVQFCRGDMLVLDGLRHVSVRDALCEYARQIGEEIRFVHIEAAEDQRVARLLARGESKAATAAHDMHASEADVRHLLRDKADVVVSRSDNTSDMVNEIVIHILSG